jgi:hypothetical protein
MSIAPGLALPSSAVLDSDLRRRVAVWGRLSPRQRERHADALTARGRRCHKARCETAPGHSNQANVRVQGAIHEKSILLAA